LFAKKATSPETVSQPKTCGWDPRFRKKKTGANSHVDEAPTRWKKDVPWKALLQLLLDNVFTLNQRPEARFIGATDANAAPRLLNCLPRSRNAPKYLDLRLTKSDKSPDRRITGWLPYNLAYSWRQDVCVTARAICVHLRLEAFDSVNVKTIGVFATLGASPMWAIERVLAKLSYAGSAFLETSLSAWISFQPTVEVQKIRRGDDLTEVLDIQTVLFNVLHGASGRDEIEKAL
jgi:hypothetical protein